VTLDIGWFSSGRGTTSPRLLGAVQNEIASGRLNARIAVVFCNRSPGEDPNTDLFLEQVRGYGLALVCLSSRDFRRQRGGKVVRKGAVLPDWRREYDAEIMRLLEPYPFDVGMLAGYMLIFCEAAAQRYDLLNLHPAAPGGPAGIWQDVIWRLIEERADSAGVMIHLATAELDRGPVVTHCTYPIRGPSLDGLWSTVGDQSLAAARTSAGEAHPLFAEIRRQGVAREIPLVVETLRTIADGRIRIENKCVLDAAGEETHGLDLTAQIEHAITSLADG